MAPKDRLVIDVGADHGYVASSLGGIATERQPHRRSAAAVPWVIADGLLPFRHVPAAIIAGMGAATIEGILHRGPRPAVAVLHAPDDPGRLRMWLSAHGWRIDAEGLAPENGRFAEVIRVMPGHEPATGLHLELGPRLRERGDPHLAAHLHDRRAHYARLRDLTAPHAPDKSARAAARVDHLDHWIASLAS